jgi:hypothetical protein
MCVRLNANRRFAKDYNYTPTEPMPPKQGVLGGVKLTITLGRAFRRVFRVVLGFIANGVPWRMNANRHGSRLTK